MDDRLRPEWVIGLARNTHSGKEIKHDEVKPGICNLFNMYSAITGKPIDFIEQDYDGKGYGQLKSDLAEIVVEFLHPIQERYGELMEDRQYLEKILHEGSNIAQGRSEMMLSKIHNLLGFIPRRFRQECTE